MDDQTPNYGFETLAIREGIERTAYNEHNEPLFLTSSFVFDNAAQAAARFAGEEDGFIYSRAGNPTEAAFQNRLAALDGSSQSVATHRCHGHTAGSAARVDVPAGSCGCVDCGRDRARLQRRDLGG